MAAKEISGVFAPIVTVFDADERIDFSAIINNIQRYNRTNLHGYMPLGSNGEFQGLTDEEALQVLDAVCKNKRDDQLVVGGCGRESVYKTAVFIEQASERGLDYAFILPPHYFINQMQVEGLRRYYLEIADRSPIPIVIYNAPKFSGGLNLSADLVKMLAVHPNIAAMKNSSPTANLDYIQATQGMDFCVIAGNIGTFYPGLCEGVVGGVLSTACYLPECCCKLFDLFQAQDIAQAVTLHQFLCELSMATIGPLGVAGVKLGMELRGMMGGHVRLPLLDASQEDRARIAQHFMQIGISTL